MLIAHSQNDAGHFHLLDEHLAKVARLAASFSAEWGDEIWAGLAGAWHDMGKARQGFQRYVQCDPDAHIEGRVPCNDKTHSAAGALHASAEFSRVLGPAAGPLVARVLQYLIAGHHAGLADWHAADGQPSLAARLAGDDAHNEYTEALLGIQAAGTQIAGTPDAPALKHALRHVLATNGALANALAVRMLFSALVDADFLDTESHFLPQQGERRGRYPDIATYAERLRHHQDRMAAQVQATGATDTPVMRARAEVLAACRHSASHPQGVFTLTVPTGGGKTLSSLAFALEHAQHHGLRRVIYAIPYTSIIEQTANVFADIFGAQDVLEHHSQAQDKDSAETTRSRLAAENWDAPLIVTTNVQLFESLFASQASRCRKLHRLAGSVIVLDEAQMLPPEFLQPVLDTLNALLSRYRISLVLCTATQPVLTELQALDTRKQMRGLPAPQPIIAAPEALFEKLRRTRVHWPADLKAATEIPELADRLRNEPCALAILNTRADAMTLARALPRDTTLHLSAAMCGAHRADVLATMHGRLSGRHSGGTEPFHVVSTQLIEAGVDADFPVVYRALAGLDSIAQAAGRCNREGRLAEHGQVHVVVRPIPRMLRQLQTAADTTRTLLAQGVPDPLAPDAFERYFELFYSRQDRDLHRIIDLLEDRDNQLKFSFKTASDKFRLVDDAGQQTLLVPLNEVLGGHEQLPGLIGQLAAGNADRWLLRQLQRYVVNVHTTLAGELERSRAIRPLPGGWMLLTDITRYDARFGLLPRDSPLDAGSLVQ